MNEEHYLYLITRDDDAQYIGVTNNVPKRILEHYKGRGSKFLKNTQFSHVIIASGTSEYIYSLEKEYIETLRPELNIAKGGYGGNGSSGSTHWNSSLTEKQVLEIKTILLADKLISYNILAKIYNVSYGTIEQIAYNNTWKSTGPSIPKRDKHPPVSKNEYLIGIIKKLWVEQGLNNEQIGTYLNISKSTISRITVNLPKKGKVTKSNIPEDIAITITNLRQEKGLSYSQISSLVNISEYIVGYFCRENNLTPINKATGKSRVRIDTTIINSIKIEYYNKPNFSHVSRVTGVSIPTVKKYLKQEGVI